MSTRAYYERMILVVASPTFSYRLTLPSVSILNLERHFVDGYLVILVKHVICC